MIFAIDVGNTNIVIGCCTDDGILFRERVSTNHTATSLEYAAIFKTAFEMHDISTKEITGSIISSVVPAVTRNVRIAAEKLTGTQAMVVGPGIKTGLSIKIDNPAQLGSDLVVDAVAGIKNYHVPLIIIDMGTATTISVIDKNSNYMGGMIIPGVSISHDSLVNRTSQLRKVALEPPKKLIGTETVECLKSGMIYGNAGALDGIIDRVREEIGECTVVATGGLAGTIIPYCRNKIIIDDDLLLKGLKVIYEKNKK